MRLTDTGKGLLLALLFSGVGWIGIIWVIVRLMGGN